MTFLRLFFFQQRWKFSGKWAQWRVRAERYDLGVSKSYREQYDYSIMHLLSVQKIFLSYVKISVLNRLASQGGMRNVKKL